MGKLETCWLWSAEALGSIPVAISWLLAACWNSALPSAVLLVTWSFDALPLLDVPHISKWIARCSDHWMILSCLLSKKGAPCSLWVRPLTGDPFQQPPPVLSLAPGRITGETKRS